MGVAVGDTMNKGLLDLYTGTFSDDYKPLFRNKGDAAFTEVSPLLGLDAPTYPFLTWATEFIDYDNDGWKDIFLVNGHVYPIVDQHDWARRMHNARCCFITWATGTNSRKCRRSRHRAGRSFAGPGAAFGDLFNDERSMW